MSRSGSSKLDESTQAILPSQGIVGLTNKAKTCYANSVFQCLAQLKPLFPFISEAECRATAARAELESKHEVEKKTKLRSKNLSNAPIVEGSKIEYLKKNVWLRGEVQEVKLSGEYFRILLTDERTHLYTKPEVDFVSIKQIQLKHDAIAIEPKPIKSVFEEFKQLLLAVWSADRGTVLGGAESARLRKSLVAHGARQFLKTSGQQDASEFLNYLLDALASNDSCNKGGAKGSDSVIKDLFCGKTTSRLTCNRCQKQSTTASEPFFSLCLPVLSQSARSFQITVVPARGQPFVLTDVALPKTESVALLKTVIISAVSDCRDLRPGQHDQRGMSTYWVLSTAKEPSLSEHPSEAYAPLEIIQDEEAPLEVFYSHQMLYMHELPESKSRGAGHPTPRLMTLWHCQLESSEEFNEDLWELVRVDRWTPIGVPLLFNAALAHGSEERLRRAVCSRVKGGGARETVYGSLTHSERLANFFRTADVYQSMGVGHKKMRWRSYAHQDAKMLFIHWQAAGALKLLTTISKLPFSKYMADAGMAHLEVANAADTPAQLTLIRCLGSAFKTEHLKKANGNGWMCDSCKMLVDAKKHSDIAVLPKVLCLQLKRFTYVAHGTHTRHEKLTRAVNFPLRGLDVSKYCLDDVCSDSDAIYDLVAVCNHFGSVENGHYTADVLSAEDQRWYNCNDSKVTLNPDFTDPDENTRLQMESDAYILFYVRRSTIKGVQTLRAKSAPVTVRKEKVYAAAKASNHTTSSAELRRQALGGSSHLQQPKKAAATPPKSYSIPKAGAHFTSSEELRKQALGSPPLKSKNTDFAPADDFSLSSDDLRQKALGVDLTRIRLPSGPANEPTSLNFEGTTFGTPAPSTFRSGLSITKPKMMALADTSTTWGSKSSLPASDCSSTHEDYYNSRTTPTHDYHSNTGTYHSTTGHGTTGYSTNGHSTTGHSTTGYSTTRHSTTGRDKSLTEKLTTTYSKPGYRNVKIDSDYIKTSVTGPKVSQSTTYSKRDYSRIGASTDELTTKTSYDQVGDDHYNAPDYYNYSAGGGHPIYVGSNYKSESYAKDSSLNEVERSYLTESFTPKTPSDEYYGTNDPYVDSYGGSTSSALSNSKSNSWYRTSADDYWSSGNNYSSKTYDGHSVRAAGKPSSKTVNFARQPYNKRVPSAARIKKLRSNRIRNTRSRGDEVNPREAVMKYDAGLRAAISKNVPWSTMTWEERLDLCRDHES